MELKEIKCNHCGHINPPGTQLCQSCGKMISEDYDKKNKRFNALRRVCISRSAHKVSLIRYGIFIIKIGVTIIALIAIAAAIVLFAGILYSGRCRCCSTILSSTVRSVRCITNSVLAVLIMVVCSLMGMLALSLIMPALTEGAAV